MWARRKILKLDLPDTTTGGYDFYVDGEGLYDNGTFIIER